MSADVHMVCDALMTWLYMTPFSTHSKGKAYQQGSWRADGLLEVDARLEPHRGCYLHAAAGLLGQAEHVHAAAAPNFAVCCIGHALAVPERAPVCVSCKRREQSGPLHTA